MLSFDGGIRMAIAIDITLETLPVWVRFAFALSVLDVVLGTIASIAQKRLSSQLGYDGLMRKMAFIALLSFVWVVLHWVQSNDFALLYSGAVSAVVVAYELASIKRHLLKLGVPKKYLALIPDDKVFTERVGNEQNHNHSRD
jgi:toxin secretion/phage lysis holin